MLQDIFELGRKYVLTYLQYLFDQSNKSTHLDYNAFTSKFLNGQYALNENMYIEVLSHHNFSKNVFA